MIEDGEGRDALGTVLVDDRGSLPFLLVHGEALVAAAAWGLGEAGVTLVDDGVPWERIVELDEPMVLHDSLCPMTPPAFIASCLDQAMATETVVAGVRPVTDTVKTFREPYVGETLDRDQLLLVCSPVVLPPRVVASLDGLPTTDLPTLVAGLREHHLVQTREAPPEAFRVTGREDVRLLEAITRERRNLG
ncbi:MAG: hypothetical protein CMH83_18365 [Nocardioides sp.]|nr:hypothetical protein [Nocardioides sp.]